jgi:low affinity Fe/Cu permease
VSGHSWPDFFLPGLWELRGSRGLLNSADRTDGRQPDYCAYFSPLGYNQINFMSRTKKKKGARALFEKIAAKITRGTGSPLAFIVAAALIIIWLVSGPLFGYSDTWQLIINTSTTIITFLMVFVIQHSQNKDTMALQLKLNELIASHEKASNRLIDIEDLTEDELVQLKKFYIKLSRLAEKEANLTTSHTLEEAMHLHESKKSYKAKTKTGK